MSPMAKKAVVKKARQGKYVGGVIVIKPTYVLMTEAEVKKCPMELHELIALGHCAHINSRSTDASLLKALRAELRKPNVKENTRLGIYDRVFE